MTKRDNQIIDTRIPSQIAGRYATNKYYASNQALIFVGPYLLDEALACSYKLEQRKVPIYGYASQYYDTVAAGKVIVSGSLTINYIDSAYLYLAMQETAFLANRQDAYSAVTSAIKGSENLGKKIAETLGQISADGPFARTPMQTRMMRDVAQMVATDPIAGDQVLKQLRQKYWKPSAKKDRAYGGNLRANNSYDSSFTRGKLSDPDQFINADLFARPDQMPAINLTVSHGNPFQKYNNTYRVIREIDIISMEQHISPTGQPQAETYHFIAKSIA